MKLAQSISKLYLFAPVVLSVAVIPTAASAQCTGVFRQCAIEVQAECTRDANGQQRITYWDRPGYTMQFEQCVGSIFESQGQPNPYKSGIYARALPLGGAVLQVPYTEVLFPDGGSTQ